MVMDLLVDGGDNIYLHVGHHVRLHDGHRVCHHNVISTLCEGSETLTEWKYESVIDDVGRTD